MSETDSVSECVGEGVNMVILMTDLTIEGKKGTKDRRHTALRLCGIGAVAPKHHIFMNAVNNNIDVFY